jgi:hypothetical protein
MALVKIKSEDNVTDGIFDVAVPVTITATTSTTSVATVLLANTVATFDDMEIEIDSGPAAFTAAQFGIEVEAMVNAAVEAGIADPHIIPTISGITRLYTDTGAVVDSYLAAPTVTPIKAYDLV